MPRRTDDISAIGGIEGMMALLRAFRDAGREFGPGAPLRATIMLCGTMFGLGTSNGAELRRHRYFETSFMLLQPDCRHEAHAVGVYGKGPRDNSHDARRNVITVAGKAPQQNVLRNLLRETYTADDARDAMGMPWATLVGLSQAIPPAYAAFIGRAFLGTPAGVRERKGRP